MYKLSIIDKISFVLLIIGALNWGFVGLFNFDLVFFLFQNIMVIGRIIYILIGVAGIDILLFCIKTKQKNYSQK